MAFESFVNSKGCKTKLKVSESGKGLRALLIQKDVKLKWIVLLRQVSLRALLI